MSNTSTERNRIARGLCRYCGSDPGDGRTCCKACGYRRNQRKAARLRAKGLCHCGRPPDPGYKTCRACRDLALARYRRMQTMGCPHEDGTVEVDESGQGLLFSGSGGPKARRVRA